MRRRHRPAILLAALFCTIAGCSSEPSPLSPFSSDDPDRHALAVREMDELARRNREAEARFYRQMRHARPTTPESSTNSIPPSTAYIREKS